MGNKKNFDELKNANQAAVLNAAVKATKRTGSQTPATEEEAEARKALMQTRGRKGVHLPRINMAFTPENHDYIKTMALITGQTMTEFLNDIITEYRVQYDENYGEIAKMREKVNAMKKK